MVILTGGTVAGGRVEDCTVGDAEEGATCSLAQRSKQINRAALSVANEVQCCHVGSGPFADARAAFWATAGETIPTDHAKINATFGSRLCSISSPAVCAK